MSDPSDESVPAIFEALQELIREDTFGSKGSRVAAALVLIERANAYIRAIEPLPFRRPPPDTRPYTGPDDDVERWCAVCRQRERAPVSRLCESCESDGRGVKESCARHALICARYSRGP